MRRAAAGEGQGQHLTGPDDLHPLAGLKPNGACGAADVFAVERFAALQFQHVGWTG